MNKRIMKKLMLILAIALCLNTVAFAEGDEPAAPAAPAQVEQVKEDKKAEAPKHAEEEKKVEPEKPAEPEAKPEAEKPAEPEAKPEAEKPAEPAPEAAAPSEEVTAPTEAPAEPEAPIEAEAPAEPEIEAPAEGAEQTAASTEGTEVGPIDAVQDPDGDGTLEIDDYETPLGVTPDAEPEPEPVPFDANVELKMRNRGEIYYGDTVILEANVTGATGAYDIRWEVDRHDDIGWSIIAGQTDASYDFVITEKNADYDYRVILTGQA